MSALLPLPERLELAHLKTTLQAWATRLTPVLRLAPVLRGQLLPVTLASGAQEVEHRLGRRLEGWALLSLRGLAVVYQHAEADALRLPLTSSAAASAVLWVW